MYLCGIYTSNVHGGQRREGDAMELELQEVVSRHMGAGNKICKSNKCSKPLSHLSFPLTHYLIHQFAGVHIIKAM